jgi:hypothetical protein
MRHEDTRGGVAALVWDVIADNQSYCETSSNCKYLKSLGSGYRSSIL